MNKKCISFFIFGLWCIAISIIDKTISSSYIVLSSSIIIMSFFQEPKIINKEKTLTQQILIPFIIAIVLFLGGILLYVMKITQYPYTIGLMISVGGGLISYYLLFGINYHKK